MTDATRRFPSNVDVLACHGNVLAVAGREGEAQAILSRALSIDSRHLPARLLRGHLLGRRQRHAEALTDFEVAVQIEPDNVDALSGQLAALSSMGRVEDALTLLNRLLAARPDDPQWLHQRARVLTCLQRHEEAAADYERILAGAPKDAVARRELGIALYNCGRYPQAATQLDSALALAPRDVPALIARGLIAGQRGQHEDALRFMQYALAIDPHNLDARVECGVAFGLLQRLEEALSCLDEALRLHPDHPEALNARGATLAQLDRLQEALDCYDRSLALRPDQLFARSDRALVLLALGDYPRGFREFEVRWEIPPLCQLRPPTDAPRWTGRERLAGRTILLHHEQGFGDTIQFVRYLPLVAAAGARVVFRVPEPLMRLFAGLPGIEQLIFESAPLPDHQFHCPLMSLPAAFGTSLTTVPASIPYLRADALDSERWRLQLGPWRRPRIGIAWAGRRDSRIADRRDLPLERLRPLLTQASAAGAQFVSLQKDVPEQDRETLDGLRDILVVPDPLADFADTAALMMNLDLVLSVDTAVVHLAAALGRAVWLMNRYAPCWRWHNDSPWYPAVRQFAQASPGHWQSVIGAVNQALAFFIRDWRPPPA